jgi:hypothetical protein
MTVEDEELVAEPLVADHGVNAYPTGGEVSALTLIEDVRAIRLRLDAIEVSLRGLGLQMEQLPAGGTALSNEGSKTGAAPVESLDELRKALLGDLQTDMRKQAGRMKLLLGVMLLTTLMGLGGLGWMVHQLE